jgi:hypothetical protein
MTHWMGLVLSVAQPGKPQRVEFVHDLGEGSFFEGIELVKAYGKPVGDAFGTHAEIWACSPTLCLRWYPTFSEDLKGLQALLSEHFQGGCRVIPVVRRYFAEGVAGQWVMVDGATYHRILWSFGEHEGARVAVWDVPAEAAMLGEAVYWLDDDADDAAHPAAGS